MAHASDGHGYDLSLADGQVWHMTASKEACRWLAEFGRILELDPGVRKGSCNIFFLRRPYGGRFDDLIADCDAVPDDLQPDGWKRYKSAVEVWYRDANPDCIINLGPEYVRRPGSENDVTEEQYDISQMSLSLFPIFRHCVDMGGIPLHAGYVTLKGRAVLLAAPGGTGKSTCCRRIPAPWEAVSDDEVLIMATGPGGYQVHPFPTWSDYLFARNRRTWNVKSHTQLSAIFFLEQSPEDQAVPMKDGVAASMIFRSSMQAYARNLMGMDIASVKSFRNKVFDNACVLAKKVPAFSLKVSLEGQFWAKIEKELPELVHL